MFNSIGIISIDSAGGTFFIDYNNLTDYYFLFPNGGTVVTLGANLIISNTNQAVPLSCFYFYVRPGDFDLNGHSFTILGVTVTQSQIDAGFLLFCNAADPALSLGYPGVSNAVFLYTDGSTQTINGDSIINGTLSLDALEDLARGSIIRGYTSNRPVAYDAKGNAKILIGDGTDINSVSVSGDITITNAGVTTIGNDKVTTIKILDDNVTNAKLANMNNNTIKANISGISANPVDVSINTLFNTFGWSLLGNSGTTPGTNFIGTSDDQDLIFKRNSLQAGLLNLADNITSFGVLSLQNLTSGTGNTAFGTSALPALTTGDDNLGLGVGAGGALITGSGNTLINGDVATSSTSGAIALGLNAVAASNEFAIPNAVTKWKFRGVSYTLPAADGTVGQALKTDGVGTLYWG